MGGYTYYDWAIASSGTLLMMLNLYQIWMQKQTKVEVGKLQYAINRFLAAAMLFFVIAHMFPDGDFGVMMFSLFYTACFGFGYGFFFYLVYQTTLNANFINNMSVDYTQDKSHIFYLAMWALYWISYGICWALNLRFKIIYISSCCLQLILCDVVAIKSLMNLKAQLDVLSSVNTVSDNSLARNDEKQQRQDKLASFWKFVVIVGLCTFFIVGMQLYQGYDQTMGRSDYIVYGKNEGGSGFSMILVYWYFLSYAGFYDPVSLLVSVAGTFYAWKSYSSESNSDSIGASLSSRRHSSFIASASIMPSTTPRNNNASPKHYRGASRGSVRIEVAISPQAQEASNSKENSFSPLDENRVSSNNKFTFDNSSIISPSFALASGLSVSSEKM